MALTDLTRISTSGIATGTSLSGAILHGDAHFRGTQVGVTSALFDSSDNALEFNDDVKLKLGNSGDFEIYHRGADGVSIINETGSAYLSIGSNGDKVELYDTANSRSMAEFATGGACSFKHGSTIRFETSGSGAVVTGILTATGFSGPTNNTSGIATFYDLRVSNNLTVEGTTTTLDTNLIGVDRIEVGADSNTVVGVAITQSGTADIVNLFDGASQVVTVDDVGNVGLGTEIPGEALHLGDNKKIGLGYGKDLELYHAGNHSYIKDTGTGRLIIQSSQLCLQDTGGNNHIINNPAGSVQIYHDFANNSTPKLETTSSGINVTGVVTATSFVGSGTNLTSIPITNGADNRIVTCTSASAITGESSFTYNVGTLIVSNASGNVTQQLNATSGDAKIVLDNSGNGNYSGIDFERERSSGAGVSGGSIFMLSDTSSNNAIMYLQAQSASAQSPVTTALSAGNGVRLKLQGGQGIFAIETGAEERLRIGSTGKLTFDYDTAENNLADIDFRTNNGLQIRGFDGNTNNAKLYIGGSNLNQRKTAIIHDPVGGYCRGDLHFCLENAADLTDVDVTDSKMVIKADGKIGINSTAPEFEMDLLPPTSVSNATFCVKGRGSGYSQLRLEGEGGASENYLTSTTVPLAIYVGAGGQKAKLDTNGMFLIGAGGADQHLHIKQSATSTYAKIENTGSSSNYTGINLKTPTLNFQIWNQGPGATGYSGSNSVVFWQAAATGPYAFFHGNNERLRIDTSGRLLINKTTNRQNYFNGGYTGQLQVEGTNDSTRLTQFIHNSSGSDGHILVIGKSRGTAVGSYTAVQDNDYLGTISFQGADGDEMVDGARVESRVNGTPGNDDMHADLIFRTNHGIATPRERLRITAKGKLLERQDSYSETYQANNWGNAFYVRGGWMRFNSNFSNPTKDLVILADGGNANNNMFIKVTVTQLDYPGNDQGLGSIHIGYASAKRAGDSSGKWYVQNGNMALESGSNFHGNYSNVGTLNWQNGNTSDTNTLRYISNRATNYDTYDVQVEVWENGNCSYYLHSDFVT